MVVGTDRQEVRPQCAVTRNAAAYEHSYRVYMSKSEMMTLA